MHQYRPLLRKLFATIALLLITAATPQPLFAEKILKTQMAKGSVGDYIVTAQGKTRVLLNIYDKGVDFLILEEIAFPITTQRPCQYASWQQWVADGAPGHTSWIHYKINTSNGAMEDAYSFSRGGWLSLKDADRFLSTLLNLEFYRIPPSQRKRLGSNSTNPAVKEWRPLWQPKMIVEGKCIEGALFDAWKAKWPKDGSELSSKTIEVYLPQDAQLYPSYFPYWLQISGMIGKARIRIVDSGSAMVSPKTPTNQIRTPYDQK